MAALEGGALDALGFTNTWLDACTTSCDEYLNLYWNTDHVPALSSRMPRPRSR